MLEPALEFPAFALQYSKTAIQSRDGLPEVVRLALLPILDLLSDNPWPERSSAISSNGKIRVYRHPSPPVEITYEIDTDRGVVSLRHFAATIVPVRRNLFISYSHKDLEWLEKVRKWLKPLERLYGLDAWDDRRIVAGAEWREEIQKSIAAAQAALLLVSQDFIASEFIDKHELPPLLEAAKEKGLLILWLAVKASTYNDSPLVKYQALNTDPSKPLEGLAEAECNRELQSVYERIKQTMGMGVPQ